MPHHATGALRAAGCKSRYTLLHHREALPEVLQYHRAVCGPALWVKFLAACCTTSTAPSSFPESTSMASHAIQDPALCQCLMSSSPCCTYGCGTLKRLHGQQQGHPPQRVSSADRKPSAVCKSSWQEPPSMLLMHAPESRLIASQYHAGHHMRMALELARQLMA